MRGAGEPSRRLLQRQGQLLLTRVLSLPAGFPAEGGIAAGGVVQEAAKGLWKSSSQKQ